MTVQFLQIAALFAGGCFWGGVLGCISHMEGPDKYDPPSALLAVLVGGIALICIGLLWAGYYFVT